MLKRSSSRFNETIQNNPHVGFAEVSDDDREALFHELHAAMFIPKFFPEFFQDLQNFKQFLKKSATLESKTILEPKHVAEKRWLNIKLSSEFNELTGRKEQHTGNIKKKAPDFITLFKPVMRDGVTIPFELEALPKLTQVWHFWRLMTGRKTPEESEFYAFLRLVVQSDFAARKANMISLYREDPIASYTIWSYRCAARPLMAWYAAENDGAGFLNRTLYLDAKAEQWLRYCKQLDPRYIDIVSKNGYYDFSKNMRDFVQSVRFGYKIKNNLIDENDQNTYKSKRGRRGVMPRILRTCECLRSSTEHYEAKARAFSIKRGSESVKPFADGVVRRNSTKCGSPVCYHESHQLMGALSAAIKDDYDDYLAFTFQVGHSDMEQIDLQREIKQQLKEWSLDLRDSLGGYRRSPITAKAIRKLVDYATIFEKTRSGYNVTFVAANRGKADNVLGSEDLSGLFIRHLHENMVGASDLKNVNVDEIREIIATCLMAMPQLNIEFMLEAKSADEYIDLCSIFDSAIQETLVKRNRRKTKMGWAKRASRTQIRSVYREMASERFKALGYAYQIDEDPIANQKYDDNGRPLVEHIARGGRGRIIGSFKAAPKQEDIYRATKDLKEAVKSSFKGNFDDLCAHMNRLSINDLPNISEMQYTRGLESLLRVKYGDEFALKFRRGERVHYDYRKTSPTEILEERRTRLDDFRRRGIITIKPPCDGDGLEPFPYMIETNKPGALGQKQYSPERVPIPD